jgi:transglutaminase-like putative cysteine protease
MVRSMIRILLFVLFGWMTLIFSASAEEFAEQRIKIERYHVAYKLNADATHVETREVVTRILDKRAIDYAKQGGLSFSTSIEKGDITDAYTLKADGRRIDVSKNSYQLEISKGRSESSPVYSDRTSLSVIFPDLEQGDATVIRYQITSNEPMFPGQFSTMESLANGLGYDEAKITFDWPVSLKPKYQIYKMTEQLSPPNEDRQQLVASYKNPRLIKSERRDFSVLAYDAQPAVLFSTFENHGAVAVAYGKRALAKVQVTPRIERLAAEISKDATAPREKAKAMYTWVAQNIQYAGNCVGAGAVVPRDVDFVLENRIGDCKDYSTLLMSLLRAANIPSEPALVNSGSAYQLPAVPVAASVNHVIVYVPSLKLFLDPTAQSIPFGNLPFSVADKPALMVATGEVARTPTDDPDQQRQSMKTVLKINPDGSVDGTIEVDLKGRNAISARDRMRYQSEEMEKDAMKQIFDRDKLGGFGMIEKDDPQPLLDTFRYKVTFHTKEYLTLPGPGALGVAAPYYTEVSAGGLVGRFATPNVETLETVCAGGSAIETYEIHFPKNVTLLATPRNVSLEVGGISYESNYMRKGNVLLVKREAKDARRGHVCRSTDEPALQQLARKVKADLKAQVVFK